MSGYETFRDIGDMVDFYAMRSRFICAHPDLMTLEAGLGIDVKTPKVEEVLLRLSREALKSSLDQSIRNGKISAPSPPIGGYYKDALRGYMPDDLTLELVSGDSSDRALQTQAAAAEGLVVHLLVVVASPLKYLKLVDEKAPALFDEEDVRISRFTEKRIFVITEIASV